MNSQETFSERFKNGCYSTGLNFCDLWVSQIAGDKDFGRIVSNFIILLTGILAVATGLLCVNLIRPGFVHPEVRDALSNDLNAAQPSSLESALQVADSGWSNLLEIFHRMVPPNLFSAAVEGQLLGLICFGLLFGFFLGQTKPEFQKTQRSFWQGLRNYSKDHPLHPTICPYWYFRLGHTHTSQSGLEIFWLMGGFALTVFLALAIHALLVLPLLLKTFGVLNS